MTATYPEDVDTGTVNIKFASFAANGVGLSGVKVTFTPSSAYVLDQGIDAKIMPVTGTWQATTDANGVASIVLPSNLDPDLTGKGWNWRVDILLPGDPDVSVSNKKLNAPWYGDVPVNGTVSLAQWANVGSTAKIVTRGAPGVGVPMPLGTAGQYVTPDGSGGTVWADLPAASAADWNTLANKPAVIGAGADQATARAAIGAASTSDITTADWNTLQNKPAVVAAGADQASARTAIGAGTSNLALGTTGTTALAGNGTAATASKWSTARTITLTGDVTGTITIDGSGNVSTALTTGTAPIDVHWNSSAKSWGTFNQDPNRARRYLSQDDSTATAPTFYNVHDEWHKAG